MYKISEEQLNALLKYLGQKPYQETYKLIEMVQNLDEFEEDKKS